MLHAEALAGAQDGRHRLLRIDRAVEPLDAFLAEIAVAAGLRRLAEIGEQGLAPAARRLGQRQERGQALAFDALALVRLLALLDLQAAQLHVAQAVEGQRIGRQPVAAGAADLLVVGLDIGRQVGMADEAHIGLVDAHAEGDGGRHHHAVFLLEGILVGVAHRLVEAGMVRQRAHAGRRESGGQFLDLAARGAIDDAALACMRRARSPAPGAPNVPWA